MISDLVQFGDWAVKTFIAFWTALGSWGIIGGFIICYGILRKIVALLKSLWKGGV